MNVEVHGWFNKVLITLWRLGLQPLLGQRFALLTHIDRATRQPERTVIRYFEVNGRPISLCMRGEAAEWFKDIRSEPFVMLQTAYANRSMKARALTEPDEIIEAYKGYKRNAPRLLDGYMKSKEIPHERTSILAEGLPFVVFETTSEAAPPAQRIDLWWVGLVIMLVLVVVRWRRTQES